MSNSWRCVRYIPPTPAHRDEFPAFHGDVGLWHTVTVGGGTHLDIALFVQFDPVGKIGQGWIGQDLLPSHGIILRDTDTDTDTARKVWRNMASTVYTYHSPQPLEFLMNPLRIGPSRRSLLPSLAVVLLALLFATTSPARPREPLLTVHSPGLADLVTVPVTVDGEQYLFMLDTGSSHHVLDSHFRSKLDKRLGSTRLRSGEVVEAYGAIPMQVGEMEVPTDWPVNTMDLSPVRRITGRPVYGILGMRFLKDYVWELDFPRDTVRAFEHLPYALPGWARLPITFNGRNQPLVPARAGGLNLPVMVDTGFDGSVALAPQPFSRLQGHGAIRIHSRNMAMTVIGMVDAPRGSLTSFDLAGLRYPGVNVHQAHLDLLGLELLGRQPVVLDFPGRQLWLAPPPVAGASTRR